MKSPALPPMRPNPIMTMQPGLYCDVVVDVQKALKSWQRSIFSFEWMHPDGRIKTAEELSAAEQEKRMAAERLIARSEPVPMPVLGIGIMDNIEIGSGRAEFLTLADKGYSVLPVHIPVGNKADFKPFLAVIE